MEFLAFGETCRYKVRAKEKQGIGQYEDRWGAGVWIGIERRTGQHLVFDKEHGGLKMARTIKPMPTSQQWVKEKVEQVDITPWSSHSASPPSFEPRVPDAELPAPDNRGAA